MGIFDKLLNNNITKNPYDDFWHNFQKLDDCLTQCCDYLNKGWDDISHTKFAESCKYYDNT